MNKFLINLRLLILTSIIFLISVPSVFALDEFSTSYKITYKYDSTGKSLITHQVSLTNNLTGVYAPSYTFKLIGETPKNITVLQQNVPQPFKVTNPTPDTTHVQITFTNPATGKGNTNTFTISYEGEPAIKNGQIWEVSLAKFADQSLANNYELIMQVPLAMGNPAFMSPPPSQIDNSLAGFHTYKFNKEQVIDSGVVAGFGNFQTLDYKLTYHLENTSNKSQSKTVAFPPDTSLQRMFYSSIDPKPESLIADVDGNWIGTYKLKPKSKLTIVTKGQVHLLGTPIALGKVKYSLSQFTSLLNPTEHWQVNDPKIQELAKTYSEPKQIFDFTVNTLSYDTSRLNKNVVRKGAINALTTPESSICTDFTDVFVSIARASGIPAREHQGYALSNNPNLQPLGINDVLHSWPEYWDSKSETWRGVDPTWTKTTGGANYFDSLDLSHFTFVIHGQSSTSPLPAGLYKTSPDTKDIEVKVGDYQDFLSLPPKANWRFPFQILPIVTQQVVVEVENPTGMAMYDQVVRLSSEDLNFITQPQLIPVLLPFSTQQLKFTYTFSPFNFSQNKIIKTSVGSQQFAYNIPSVKFIFWYGFLIITIIASFIGLAIIAHHAWHLYLQKHPRENNLRR